MRRVSPLVIVAVLSAFPVAAQESSVADAADRPGFADTPVLLGRGHVQLEFGFTSEHEGGDSGTVRSFTAPQTELHAGVFSRVDVSVSWDGFVSATAPASRSGTEEHDTGYADVRLGTKLALVHRPRLDTAVITYVNVPVGNTGSPAILMTGSSAPASSVVFVSVVDDRSHLTIRHTIPEWRLPRAPALGPMKSRRRSVPGVWCAQSSSRRRALRRWCSLRTGSRS